MIKKYRIINAYKYETQDGIEKVMIEGLPQVDKPVYNSKKVFLKLSEAQEICWKYLDLDKQTLWLFGKYLLVQESYALESNSKADIEEE